MHILEKFGIKDADTFENVLGIDLGHGETSAAVININGDGTAKDLYFNNNNLRKIITALYISDDGREALIGNEAIKAKGRLYTGFKDRPDRLDNKFENDNRTKGELLRIYFQMVVATLYKYNKLNLQGKTLIVVGCPSSSEWLRYDEEYADILSEGLHTEGGQMPVIIMPESRAALIKIFREQNDNVFLDHGAMIFDSGSSTFDCTYINQNKKIGFEFSEPLGASYIERKMLENFLGRRVYDDVKDLGHTLIDLRLRKEQYFEFPEDDSICYRLKLKNDETTGLQSIDNTFMEDAVAKMNVAFATSSGPRKGSWKALCEQYFQYAYSRVKENPPETVLITGGASRMQFLQDLCRKTFPKAQVVCDDEPSFSVSRGLAWAGLTDLKCANLLEKTKSNIKDGISNSLDGLFELISNKFSDRVYQFACKNFEQWAAPAINNETLQTVLNHIRDDFIRFLGMQDAKNLISGSFDTWLDMVKTIIVMNVNQSFKDEYPGSVQEIKRFTVDDEKWDKIKEMLINSNDFVISVDDISKYFDLDSGGTIFLKIILCIVLLPFAVFDGIFDTNISGWAGERIWDVNKNKSYNKKNRDKMFKQYIEKKDNIMKQLRENIQDSLKKSIPSEKRKNIVDTVYQNIECDVEGAVDTVSLYFTTR